jgi:D-serine deaminase-like pyridoxal phosphate-dependent protein
MTISWPNTGTLICDGATRAVGLACGPSGLTVPVRPGLRMRTYVDGGGPKYEETGNDPATVSFGVAILCDSAAAAAALIAALVATTPRVGTLTLEGGLVLADAGMEALTPRQSGRRVFVEYSFSGRAVINNQEPAP